MFTGDIESLRRDLVDPAGPMKSSAFASEEPAPFTPVSLKGSLILVLLIMLPRDVYLRLLVTIASKKNTCNCSKAQETKTRETSLLASGEELALSGKNGK